MMPVLLQESDGKWFQFMAFFAVCALAFVGAAPHFKGFDRPVHMTAAALCAINLITWAILMGFWLVVALYVSLLIIIVFAFKQQHHRMFWAEMACFAAAYHVCIYLAF
jgi:hypothetical protein